MREDLLDRARYDSTVLGGGPSLEAFHRESLASSLHSSGGGEIGGDFQGRVRPLKKLMAAALGFPGVI